jgi:hypothetical protein
VREEEPNAKSIPMNEIQNSKPLSFGHWKLVFGFYLGFGFSNLEFDKTQLVSDTPGKGKLGGLRVMALLDIQSVTKRFGGLLAIHDVSL